jgi:hypothetical protein
VEENVYNFHVAELQNYAVGECGVLVHNSNTTGKGGVQLTRGGQKQIGNLADMKDMKLADAIKQRGGGQSQIQKLNNPPSGNVGQMSVGEIANAAAREEAWAVAAMKMLKQAGSQGKGGK